MSGESFALDVLRSHSAVFVGLFACLLGGMENQEYTLVPVIDKSWKGQSTGICHIMPIPQHSATYLGKNSDPFFDDSRRALVLL